MGAIQPLAQDMFIDSTCTVSKGLNYFLHPNLRKGIQNHIFWSEIRKDGIYGDIFINKTVIFYYWWDLFNYFNIMNCKALWSISGVSAI